MNREQLEAAIWQAVTYAGDEGTCGYLLTPGQVQEILAAADQYQAHGIVRERGLHPAGRAEGGRA